MLNERLKEKRIELHLSQEYVAEYIGVKRTAIVEIESGKRKVSAIELGKFSELYNTSCDELIKGKSEEISEESLFINFASLDERDREEILNLIEFKKMMKLKRTEMINA